VGTGERLVIASRVAMSIQWARGSEGDSIANDDTFFPILISTWFGSPTETLVRSYYRWLHEQLDRSKRERLPLIIVTDSGPAGVPSAEVRRLIADLTLEWDKAGATEARVGSYVVIENALMRGVITTLNWLHGNLQSENVATCERALTLALNDLSRRRVPAPTGLVPAKYRRPERR
jgi:hypothetical protein